MHSHGNITGPGAVLRGVRTHVAEFHRVRTLKVLLLLCADDGSDVHHRSRGLTGG